MRSPNSPTKMTTKAVATGRRPPGALSASRSPFLFFRLLGDEQEVGGTAGEEQGGDRLDPPVGEQVQELAGGDGDGGVDTEGGGAPRSRPAPAGTGSP